MLTLAMSKCPSSVDVQQHLSSFKGGGMPAIDYRSNCPHQLGVQTSSNRFEYNSHQSQTSATASNTAAAYFIDNGDEQMYQCNDAICNSNSSRLINRRSLTLMRPLSLSATAAAAAAAATKATITSSTTAASNESSRIYKDQYLRQFTNKLPILQSFVSTPDLTSESSRADDTTNCPHELDEQMLALMPPPPPAMPLLTSKILSATTPNNRTDLARPDVIQLHTFRCFHHHKHNQAGGAQTLPSSKSSTKESTATVVSNANENSTKQSELASGKV